MPHPSPNHQPPLRAVPMGLFPTMGSLQDVLDYAESKVPISSKNDVYALLMTYHNTLLHSIRTQPNLN